VLVLAVMVHRRKYAQIGTAPARGCQGLPALEGIRRQGAGGAGKTGRCAVPATRRRHAEQHWGEGTGG
jgi:hypothetical protein